VICHSNKHVKQTSLIEAQTVTLFLSSSSSSSSSSAAAAAA
jgi:hypothetical protein